MRRARSLGSSAALALTLLGLSSALATITHCRPLAIAAQASAASPLPLVFGRLGAHEAVRQRFALTLYLRSGERVVFADGRDVARRVAGPFQRRKIYIEQLIAGRVAGPRSILVYGLCAGGPLARDLGIVEPVESFTVRRWDAGGEETVREQRAACP